MHAVPQFGHTNGAGDNPAYGFAYHVGPRITLPIGPVELFADWQAGGISSTNRPTALTGSDDGVGLHGRRRTQLLDQREHHARPVRPLGLVQQRTCTVSGKLRYTTAGIALTLQQSPPAPPPAPAAKVAAAPPPEPRLR